ncbi:MAG: CinA family protein [Christensenellales bacterium]
MKIRRTLIDVTTEVVKILTESGKTVATMESCTGGALANAITNIPGAGEVFNFGAVTYANDFKVKMGVDAKVIEDFTVYSEETANEMSKSITMFADADFGVGITGKLKRVDNHNKDVGQDDVVFISVFNKRNNKFYNRIVTVCKDNRIDNKEYVIRYAVETLFNVLCEDYVHNECNI